MMIYFENNHQRKTKTFLCYSFVLASSVSTAVVTFLPFYDGAEFFHIMPEVFSILCSRKPKIRSILSLRSAYTLKYIQAASQKYQKNN